MKVESPIRSPMLFTSRRERARAVAIMLVAVLQAVVAVEAWGWQTTSSAERTDAPPPARDPLPSLDELLGLAKERPGRGGSASETSDLDRQLLDQSPGDDFSQAVDLLDRVAARLERDQDTGLPTQRMQEEAIRRLDKLIADARRQRQPQRQRQNQQPRPQDQEQAQSQPQPSPSSSSSSQAQTGQENQGQEMDPGDRRSGSLRQIAPGGSAAWGSLPEHIRSSLMQGFSDQFSSMYQSMTEAYYRRLAEDQGRDRRSGPEDRPVGGPR